MVASQCRSQTECGADEHAPSRPRRHRMGCRPPPHQKAVRSLTLTHDRRVRLCACAAARAVHRAATEATGDRTTSVRVTSIRATVSPELCRRRDLRHLGCHRPSQASRVVGGASPYRPSEEPARAAVPPSRCPGMSSRVSCESEGARVMRCVRCVRIDICVRRNSYRRPPAGTNKHVWTTCVRFSLRRTGTRRCVRWVGWTCRRCSL